MYIFNFNSNIEFVLYIPNSKFTLLNKYTQYVAKSIATCKKNPYIINQNHIFSKNYCEVISG